MCSRAVLLVLTYASFDNRELRLYRSVVLEVNSVLMTLGERVGPWFKRKYRPGKKKKARHEVVFILLYIFMVEASQPSPSSWVYNNRKQEQWNSNRNRYQESQGRLQIAFPLAWLNTCASGN